MNIEQTVMQVLTDHPETRLSYNRLVVGYWKYIDHSTDFDKLTPLESICRAARKIWGTHPELSPTAAQVTLNETVNAVGDLFPGTVTAKEDMTQYGHDQGY